ncbi:hypothetical protein D3C79_846170 [compost metagenome]
MVPVLAWSSPSSAILVGLSASTLAAAQTQGARCRSMGVWSQMAAGGCARLSTRAAACSALSMRSSSARLTSEDTG